MKRTRIILFGIGIIIFIIGVGIFISVKHVISPIPEEGAIEIIYITPTPSEKTIPVSLPQDIDSEITPSDVP